MPVDTNQSFSSVVFSRILRLLEKLNTTASGTAIYQHIEQSFQSLELSQIETAQQYIKLLKLLLNNLTRDLSEQSPQKVEAHILKMSLVPATSIYELKLLEKQVEQLIDEINQQNSPGTDAIGDALKAVLDDVNEPETSATPLVKDSSPVATPETLQEIGDSLEAKNSKQTSDTCNFQYMEETRNNIQNIQSTLEEQINSAKQLNSELATLIKNSIDAMRSIDSQQDIKKIRDTYLSQGAGLIKSHQDLVTKFDTINTNLSDIENNSQYLDEELNRVHRLSLTDELTNLPNRRALLQRLEDEVTRVQRYGFPLALAIIDLDEFKPINDNFGHDVGDQVLKHFAETALSVFRHHDTLARYGGEEFAALLPNTDAEGALCALQKIQQQLGNTYCRLDDGAEISTPTFSAGIAIYSVGETADELIKRADTAMYRAKRAGRNRIEVHTLGAKHKAAH